VIVYYNCILHGHDKEGRDSVVKEITIWYNKKGDYLEVIFEQKVGYFRETENDAVMEKVDRKGNNIGIPF